MLDFFSQIMEFIKNLCFPPSCYICNDFTETNGLCSECWKNITWITEPKCKICGVPFAIQLQDFCPNCERKRPKFDMAISIFVYNKYSKKMILHFKNYDCTYMANQFAKWLYRIAEKELTNTDIIIPVPITTLRRITRKYNQSELLAMSISELSHIKYEPRILIKSKSTKSQEGLTRLSRQKNLIGSFSVNSKFADLLKDKNVALVDDVITTGSTANECAKVLKKYGAKNVIVLTIAHTVLNNVELQ